MSSPARSAVRRLVEAAEVGVLADFCERLDIDLFVLFGSAASDGPDPHDVDVVVRFRHGRTGDALAVLDGLYDITGYEGFDLLDLGRAGPLARDRALSSGRPLYQERAGGFGNAQIAAMMERLETEEFRRLELELMSR